MFRHSRKMRLCRFFMLFCGRRRTQTAKETALTYQNGWAWSQSCTLARRDNICCICRMIGKRSIDVDSIFMMNLNIELCLVL